MPNLKQLETAVASAQLQMLKAGKLIRRFNDLKAEHIAAKRGYGVVPVLAAHHKLTELDLIVDEIQALPMVDPESSTNLPF